MTSAITNRPVRRLNRQTNRQTSRQTSRRSSGRITAALGATLGIGGLLAGIAFFGASAHAQDAGISPAGQQNVRDFGSCLAAEKSANILLVIDQSASLKGFNDSVATDPDNIRVDGTQVLVNEFHRLAADSGSHVQVKLAGFGEGYHNAPGEYGNWIDVGKDPTALDSAIKDFSTRNSDNFTDYEQALSGASREFAGAPAEGSGEQSDCQAVFFFSDGIATSQKYGNDAEAAAAVCTPSSPLVSLRNSRIRLFTIGLVPEGTKDNPRELLRSMAEGSCGGGKSNGAYAEAHDANALVAAFSDIVPAPNSINSTASLNDPTKFTLDNSIDAVRLSALPTSSIGNDVTPTLTSPDGNKVPLTTGETTIGGAKVTVAPANTQVKGEVTAELTLSEGGNWAGEWSFGYDAPPTPDDRYKARITLAPGLTVNVDELSDKTTTGLKNDGQLHATIVDSDGKPRALDGEAVMTARFTTSDGTQIELGEQPARDGTAVAFPLDRIEHAASGTIDFTAQVTTKSTDKAPGSLLSPVSVSFPVTVTPVNMPTLGTSGPLDISAKETTINVPVSGPGKVWVESTTLTAGDEGIALPEGVNEVRVSSSHGDNASALELGKDETGVLPVTVSTSELADGRLSVTPKVHLVSDDGTTDTDIDLPLSGNMTAPVNTGVFAGVLVAVLLAAILIPLAVLYLMKVLAGRIPSSPGIHAVRIPVKVTNGRLLRTDRGGDFQVDYNELLQSGRTVASGREVNLAGVPVRVKLGVNPLSTPVAVVDSAAPTISDEGRQIGSAARLPLAVHNHWIVIGTPGDPTTGEIVLAVDEFTSEERVHELAAAVSANAPELLERLAATAPESAGPGSTNSAGTPSAGPGTTWPGAAQPGSGFGGIDSNGSPNPGSRPATGGPTPFGGPGGSGGSGTSGGGWGSNPGNGAPGGPSPFGR